MPIISGSGEVGGKISGVTVTGTAASGEVPVASSSTAGAWAFPPGFELAYVEFTSPVTVTGGSGAAVTVVDSGTVAYDGTAILIEFFAPLVRPANSDFIAVSLVDGASNLAQLSQVDNPTTGTMDCPVLVRRKLTPTAGSHNYKVVAWRNVSNGTVFAATGGNIGSLVPGYIRVTKP